MCAEESVVDAWRLTVTGLPTHIFESHITGVGIGLQDAAEVLQVPRRVLALAVGRVLEPHRRRRLVAAGTVVANVDPQPAVCALLALAAQRRIGVSSPWTLSALST